MNISKIFPSRWQYGIREYAHLRYVDQNKMKPCYIGDNVHLCNRSGIYRVVDVDYYSFTTQTKYGDPVRREWKHFKCLAGGHWNIYSNTNYFMNHLDY